MQLRVVGFASACACGVAAAMGILFSGSSAQAQTTYYWTTTPGAMTAGSGTWDTATPNWSTTTTGDSTLSPWSNSPVNDADFLAGGTSTVMVNGAQSVGNITFDGSGYTVIGGALTASGAITTNQNAAIGCTLGGGAGLLKSGSATLTLIGSQAYGGPTTVANGTLLLAAAPSLVNPSFEGPSVGTNNWTYLGINPSQQTTFGWATAGNLINGPGPALENGNSAWGFTAPPDGAQACVLQERRLDQPNRQFPQGRRLSGHVVRRGTARLLARPGRSPLGRRRGEHLHLHLEHGVDQLRHDAECHGRDPHHRVPRDDRGL